VTIFKLILLAGLPACAAEWGPTADGLRMSAAVADDRLQVTIQNVSDQPVLIVLGNILNQKTMALRFRTFLTGVEGIARPAIVSPNRIRGDFQITPLSVQLISNASYTVELPLSQDQKTNGSHLRVELDTSKTECPPGCAQGTRTACWRGRLESNSVALF
jgi:hypothetical protein